MGIAELSNFYNGKRVLVTGHTGFKGTWLCKILCLLGATVYGYSLEPPTEPSMFNILCMSEYVNSKIGDIRDYCLLQKFINKVKPEYVFHLAAQPIVRESYRFPRETYEVNVMGTVNILECMRNCSDIRSFLNVTTDKVYENNDELNHAFMESEKLDGYDPYSNSKSCSELVTHSYKNSFFDKEDSPAISTARAGNVIGGGDFASDRIIPDCVRAMQQRESICIRNAHSIRPYQHILEPLFIYLTIVMEQEKKHELAGYYNVGPDDNDCITTGQLADLFVNYWGEDANWRDFSETKAPHEASYLKLDCTTIKNVFDWEPVWHIEEAVERTVEWYKAWITKKNMNLVTENQIRDFFNHRKSI